MYIFMHTYSELLKSVCLSLQVHHGKDCGFFIFDQGKGYLELNDIFANRIAGVEIKNKADPILYRNNIHHGQTGGVYIHEKVCPVFVNTTAGTISRLIG